MREDRIYEINRIINENLTLLDVESASVTERRLAQLFDRAVLISRDESLLISEERCSEFSSLFNPGEIPAESSDPAKPYLGAYYESQLLLDKITVCEFVAQKIGNMRGFNLSSLLGAEDVSIETPQSETLVSGLYQNEKPVPKVAYLKNAYADNAFMRFLKLLGSLSVDYCGDFTSVCEEVYYGRAEMCMLPLDSSRDAKLISFFRLIDKYELKVVISCDVSSSDNGVTTRYALLKKNISVPDPALTGYDTLLFEFDFVPDENISLAEVLFAAEKFGLKLYKVDAIPLSYSDSEFSYDVILSCRDHKIEAFALFMALAAPQYEPIGFYPHLRNR
jgi:hypothetical protein